SVSKFNYMKNEALHAFAKFYSDLTV
ncbi:hypothetical protein BV232_15900, partial [Lactiplantibacillus plantarum]